MEYQILTEKRKKPSDPKVAELLVVTRRKCCLCYFLENDHRRKKVQIAHIDQKRNNSDASNLVPLCLDHHDEFDSVTRQSKNITMHELKMYKEMLIQELSKDELKEDEIKVTHKNLPDLSSAIFYDYGKLYFDICIDLFNADPVGINFGDNLDEYTPEVHDIIARLQDNPDNVSTEVICEEVFFKWFSEDIAKDFDFSDVAKSIELKWEQFVEANNVYE